MQWITNISLCTNHAVVQPWFHIYIYTYKAQFNTNVKKNNNKSGNIPLAHFQKGVTDEEQVRSNSFNRLLMRWQQCFFRFSTTNRKPRPLLLSLTPPFWEQDFQRVVTGMISFGAVHLRQGKSPSLQPASSTAVCWAPQKQQLACLLPTPAGRVLMLCPEGLCF